MKVLIIQTAFIGDAILASSLVKSVKELYPESQIDFLLRAGNESLFANHSLIRKVHIWNKKKKLKSLIQNIFNIRKEKYDLCINIQRYFNSGILTLFSSAKITIGFDKNPLSLFFSHRVKHFIPDVSQNGHYLHEVQRNLKLLRAYDDKVVIPKDPKTIPLQLDFSKPEITKVNSFITERDDYLVMAPSSVWFTKRMEKIKWAELTSRLSKEHYIFFIGAPSDKADIDSIINQSKNCENLAGKLSLTESALLMKKAKRVFVNDSAPLHLASAVQAKTTAIFCSTSPDFGYGPLAKDSVIIQAAEEKRNQLDCKPCGLHGKKACPVAHFNCSKLIKLDDIIKTIK